MYRERGRGGGGQYVPKVAASHSGGGRGGGRSSFQRDQDEGDRVLNNVNQAGSSGDSNQVGREETDSKEFCGGYKNFENVGAGGNNGKKEWAVRPVRSKGDQVEQVYHCKSKPEARYGIRGGSMQGEREESDITFSNDGNENFYNEGSWGDSWRQEPSLPHPIRNKSGRGGRVYQVKSKIEGPYGSIGGSIQHKEEESDRDLFTDGNKFFDNQGECYNSWQEPPLCPVSNMDHHFGVVPRRESILETPNGNTGDSFQEKGGKSSTRVSNDQYWNSANKSSWAKSSNHPVKNRDGQQFDHSKGKADDQSNCSKGNIQEGVETDRIRFHDSHKNIYSKGNRDNNYREPRNRDDHERQEHQGRSKSDATHGCSKLEDNIAIGINYSGMSSKFSVHSQPGIHDLDLTQAQISKKLVKGMENSPVLGNQNLPSLNVPCSETWQHVKSGIDSDSEPFKDEKAQFGKESSRDVLNNKSSEPPEIAKAYDICMAKTGTYVVLKPSLLDRNRERRKEMKRVEEGQRGQILGPGLVLLKNHLSISEQAQIVMICRRLGLGPGGFYQPGYRDGAKLHLKMMCLGKNWDPETSQYVDVRPVDGARPPPLPSMFNKLVHEAINESHVLIRGAKNVNVENTLPSMSPDLGIVNFYTASGKLGLHQDRDESEESLTRGLPVVSFSIGDAAEFLYSDQRDPDKADKVLLESGDVLIFGGKSRHIFHGVKSLIPNTAPKSLLVETDLRPGRLNLTFRQY